MLHEISRQTIKINKYEDIDVVWHNNVLTVRCDSGLHLLEFSHNLSCLDEGVDFHEAKINTTKSSPASELFPENVMKCTMKNIELTQMILDPALWPHSNQLMKSAVIYAFEWSPIDFIYNNDAVVATLNSIGNIDIFAPERHKWVRLEDLSQKLKKEMEDNSLIPPVMYEGPINLTKVKKAAYALESNAIAWSPLLNMDKSCFFVTAQKNGYILFWLLRYIDKSIDVQLIDYICDNSEEIIAIKWIPTSDTQFLLICSNVHGQILAYEFQLDNNILKHLNTYPLWDYKDKIITQYIQFEYLDNNIVIACNKHRHLLLQVIDKNCKILSQNISVINDERITSVVRSKCNFYVSTLNREIFLVKYNLDKETLNVNFIPVELKSVPAMYELYGFAYSTNNAMLALALLDRTILCRKIPMKLDIIVYADRTNDIELPTIINNPSKTLTDMWDIIEAFRSKTMKAKALPSFDYNKLYEDAKTDMYLAKVFLIVLTFNKSLELSIKYKSKVIVPDVSLDDIKSLILSFHAVDVMQRLYETCSREIVENKFEYECFVMAGTYLEGICQKSENKLNDFLATEIVDIFQKMKTFLKYTCQSCDETLDGFVCKDGHLNMFCAVTFTMIESHDYFVCRSCGVTIRSDLYLDKPKCVFCDLYLCNCFLPC